MMGEWSSFPEFSVNGHETRNNGIPGAGSAKEKQPRVESVWLNAAALSAVRF